MLKLNNIVKTYESNSFKVEALKNVNIEFRNNEFVSILGPSGCGKTTLLNIIGGLDRYTSGDLIINGKSTKEFKDYDWDTYRNHSIGFVFQSYNLIPHQTVLGNVELALSIGGVGKTDRRQRAIEALEKVGLKNQINKKPNQLSGGQMQRVSIARALVNNPDIILADEPTGALDSETSVQVMEILKEISKDRLVIMVTHNPDLANRYSTRIINIFDGNITGDTNPISDAERILLEEEEKQANESKQLDPKTRKLLEKKTSMSFLSALRLSLNNLLSKKKRTFITSLAGSIGIIGIATILAVSSGMQDYVNKVQEDSTSMNYILIQETHIDREAMIENGPPGMEQVSLEKYPENTTGAIPYVKNSMFVTIKQDLSTEYLNYLKEKTEGHVIGMGYSRSLEMNILTKNGTDYSVVSTSQANFQEMIAINDYVNNQYEILAGTKIPSEKNEIAIVVDEYNRIPTSVLDALCISYNEETMAEVSYEEFLGKEIKIALNDGFYKLDGSRYKAASTQEELSEVYNNTSETEVLKVVSVVRMSKDASSVWSEPGVIYTPSLTEYLYEDCTTSAVGLAQKENTEVNVITGENFNLRNTQETALRKLGISQTPTSIIIYPKDYNSKEAIMRSLDSWNDVKTEEEMVRYTDVSNLLVSMLSSTIDIISYVLIAFSSISLVVSSIMIAIIIYASVIERIKEIGVLRSVGARKKDISRVFKSEAVILGFVSGVIAIIVTAILCIIINIILGRLVNITTIASLTVGIIISMIALNVVLTLIASLIPASLAAKKDPVLALRSE